MADPAPVHAISPDGREVEIRPEKVNEAAGAGYRIQSADEYAAAQLEQKEGLLGAAKAFGENAASTATLGLSDVAAGALGGNDYRRARALRELAFPTASTAGEVTGMVAPLLLPGLGEAAAARGGLEGAEGVGMLGRAAGAAAYTPAGLAARAGEAASGLVGRGLEGLGVTGESLLGRAASSGLRAGAAGAVEGAAYGAGNALSEAALAPDGDYDGLAQKLWASAIHGAEFGAALGGGLGAGGELLGAAARKIGGTFSAQKALRELADAKTLKSAGYLGSDISKVSRSNPERIHELAEALRREEGIGWSDTLADRATKIDTARAEAGEALGTMRKSLDEARQPGEGVHVRQVLDDASARVEEMRAKARTTRQDKFADRFSEEVERMKKNFAEGEPVSFEAAHEFRRTIDDELSGYRDQNYPGRGRSRPPDPFEREMMRLRTDLEQHFEAAAEKVSTTPEFRAQYQDAKARYGALKELSAVSKKRVGSLAGNRDISLTDTMAGLTGFATMGPAGILAAAANRAIRSTQADHVVGILANELAKLNDTVSSSVARWAASSRKAAKGTNGAMARAAKTAAKAGRATIAGTARSVEGFTSQQEHVREYFGKLRAVEEEARSAPGTLVHIPDAPKTAEAAEAVRRRQAQWLMSQAPVPPAQIQNPVLARIARQAPPNIVDTLKWLRKVRTIEDPKSALRALEEGRLTSDHVAALEQTPAVLQMFRRAALEQVTDHNSDMSYESRIQLGVLLGVTTDPSLRPESIAAGQAVYARRRQAQQQAEQQAPSMSAAGKRPMGTDSALDTMEANAGRI